jgi:P4 family phage/plasmid primase-like protien
MTREQNPNPTGFTRYICKFLVQRGGAFTHTSISKPGGSYYVPVEHINDFYTNYCNALEKGDDLYITEKNRHISPVKVDLDFRWSLDKSINTSDNHIYTKKNVQEIVEAYVEVLQQFFDIEDSKQLRAYVLEKPKYSKNETHIKEGIHIMFPHLVSKASVQYLVRNALLSKLEGLFKAMDCANPASDIIDEAIIERNNWLMYGSKKQGGEPYKVTRIFKFDKKMGTIKELVQSDEDEKSKMSEYVKLMSLRNKYDESKINPKKSSEIGKFEEEQEERRRKMETARNIIIEKISQRVNQCEDTDLEQIKKLVAIMNLKRANNYNDWIRLGWCLRNIDHRLADVWETFSKRSDKYHEGECLKIWNYMKEGGLGIGTLHMWAKHDNMDAYREIMRNDLRDLIFQSRSGTHNDVARVIHYLYKYDFVCISVRYKNWYEFRGHRWVPCDGACTLRMKISNDVWREYMAAARDWTQRAMDATNASDQSMHQDHAKRMHDIALKLKTTNFKDYLMKECAELFYVEKFEDWLDSNENLIGFTNGVFDLDTMEFREGRPEDHISFSTGNDYIEYDPTNKYVHAIKVYLTQVLPKPEVREYVMRLFATFLHGAVKEQKFYIWTGSGSNSKSKLVELFERSFGEYCCKFPITLLTMKRAASNAATSELARAKGKRFGCLQEPSEDEKLNIGLMKELSGGDKIMARAIYKEPVEFKPQFKMLLLCNHLPHVPSDDGGTWRRIRVVEFISKFVDHPEGENEYPIDLELSTKMEAWRPHFIAMLIEVYKIYKQEGIQEPEEVLSCTRDYKRNNDHLADFIHNCVEKKDSAFLSLNEAFAELKSWAKDDNIPIKIPTKAELEKYLSKNLTKCVSNNQFKGYKGYRLKNRYQAVAEYAEADGIDEE